MNRWNKDIFKLKYQLTSWIWGILKNFQKCYSEEHTVLSFINIRLKTKIVNFLPK